MRLDEQAVEYSIPITEWLIQALITESLLCARHYVRCLDSLISLIVEGFISVQEDFPCILGQGINNINILGLVL